MLRGLFLGASLRLSVDIPGVLGEPPVYDEAEAKQFAALSSVTYCEKLESVYNWTCAACADSKVRLVPGKIKFIDSDATRILVGKLANESGCLVSFRGTDNMQNWLQNLDFFAQAPAEYDNVCKGCKVHRGFYNLWHTVEPAVDATLAAVGCAPGTPDAQNIYMTGHSQGAALAHLAVFSLVKHGYNVTKMYTFESPRTGNKVFAEEFTKRFAANFPVFRITHHMDPVVHMPPAFIDFQHVQTEVYYDENGNHKVCNMPEDTSCSAQYSNFPGMLLLHSKEHCKTSLLSNGDFCWPVGCLNEKLHAVKDPQYTQNLAIDQAVVVVV